MARRPELRAAALAALLAGLGLALLALAGCGSGDEPANAATKDKPSGVIDISGTEPVGEMSAGSVAALADCSDWKGGNEKQRVATIDDIRGQLNPQDGGFKVPELTDAEAEEMFDRSCKPSWAKGFRLYKLYAQAVGFVSVKRAIDGG